MKSNTWAYSDGAGQQAPFWYGTSADNTGCKVQQDQHGMWVRYDPYGKPVGAWPTPQQATGKVRKSHTKRNVFAVLGGVAAVAVIIAVSASSSGSTSTTSTTGTSTSTAAANPACNRLPGITHQISAGNYSAAESGASGAQTDAQRGGFTKAVGGFSLAVDFGQLSTDLASADLDKLAGNSAAMHEDLTSVHEDLATVQQDCSQ